MIRGVRRVSVAVRDLDAALAFYRDGLGFRVVKDLELAERGLHIVRLDAAGTELELMQATDPSGAVADFIARRGEGLHHVALEVDDLELEMRTLLARGFELLDREPRDGPDGRLAFVSPKSTGGVLLELDEAPVSTETPPTTDEGSTPTGIEGSPPPSRITESVSFLPRFTSELPTTEEHREVP
jgi:methylmalonyl-CoA epimerase